LKAAALIALALGSVPAGAQERPAADVFALVIGVNRSANPRLPVLHYADDDAARFTDVLRSLGAHVVVLADVDENTARLHPGMAQAWWPDREHLSRATHELAREVAAAQRNHHATELMVIYAGHGEVSASGGAILLADARLYGLDLTSLIDEIHADRTHLIVDACYSSFLAYERGPGGRRHKVRGFARLTPLVDRPDVGLLLSTSAARESHEWEGIQAGVFSHEVRSGLYGAADADGDGRISYREIAAFVERANANVPNERFRPDVYARPPRDDDLLLDLRWALGSRRIDVGGPQAAHYRLEDDRGVVLAEFHSATGQAVHLLHPANAQLYMERVSDDAELKVPEVPIVAVVDLSLESRAARARGAAHEAFRLLFTLPFERAEVERYQYRVLESEIDLPAPAVSRRKLVGWSVIGLSAVSAGSAFLFDRAAQSERDEITPHLSQAEVARRNDEIAHKNMATTIFYTAGAAALVTGVVVLLWPDSEEQIALARSRFAFDGRMLVLERRF